jgi:cation diffusion facilitator family transporter
MSTQGGNRAVIAALLANLAIAVAKFVGFAITRSSSMLAEGVHSLADTGNQLLLLLGSRRARRAPTAEHPFGYGRERYFWAFVVSIVLFALGSIFAIFEGVEKLLHPHELESPIVAIVILLVAIVAEGFSFRTAVGEANHVRGRSSWPQFIRRSKAPELPVVLLEDFGALIGLVIALTCLVLAAVTGSSTFDGIGSVIIGVLLGIIAIVLATEMKSLLIGESASASDEGSIIEAIEGHDQVRSVIHLRTEHIGPEELLVGAKVDFVASLSMAELAVAIDSVEAAVRAALPSARVIYLEPDIARSSTSASTAADGAPAGPVDPAADRSPG